MDDTFLFNNIYWTGVRQREVVLQLNGRPTGQLNALLRREGVRLKGSFDGFDSMAVSLPSDVVEGLASFEEVEVIAPGNKVVAAQAKLNDLVRQHPRLGCTPKGRRGRGPISPRPLRLFHKKARGARVNPGAAGSGARGPRAC